MFKMKAKRLAAIFLAVIMTLAALPMSAFAAPASDIPAEMLDNHYLDALAYTGYNVQSQMNDGTIFKTYGSRLAGSSILSGITYGYTSSGLETDGSGKPDIAAFRSGGLCCASYVSYVYFNYLPNVAGVDVSSVPRPQNYRSASGISAAADSWVAAGLSRRITFTQNANRDNFVPSEEIPIGSLIVFKSISEGGIAHVALYAGYYNGQYFVKHVGNDRGPEISTIVGMSKGGYPEAVLQVVTPPVKEDGTIEVYKKDPQNRNLSGAVFVATNKKTNVQYKIGPTDANGYAKSDVGIPYGDYKVVETVFPANYRAYGQTEWNVTVNSDNKGVVIIHAVNEEIPGSAKIIKTSEDGKVEGISFTVTGQGFSQTVKTNSKGEWQIDNLKPGTYTVTEQAYDKYNPQESRTVTVVSGKVATVTFNNTLKRGDLTVTKTAEDGLEQGMKFHLFGTSLSGLAVDEYAIVGADGKAKFQGVLIGTGYTIEEVGTPDRYIVPDNQTADIEWKKVTGKTFENILKRGDLVVTKTAEDGLTEGMRFRLHGTSYSGLPVDETRSVGSDGKAYFNDILIGTGYVLEEVGTPDRYVVPDDQTADIEWEKVTNKDFHNTLKKWNVTVTKRDSETGKPQGDATLAGAVYGIYQGGELIDRYTTDTDGKFTTKYYLCGDDWTLREITPSEGYLLDETTYHIGAEAKNYTVEYNAAPAIGSPEDIIKGKIAIIKHTDDGSTQIETPEVGAEFVVYLKSAGGYDSAKPTERDRLVCDENGFAETKELPYGVYTVHQVSGWEGRELLPDFDVYIAKDGQTYRYLINNRNFESYIKIVKTDAETGRTIPYAGAGFQIYDPEGNLVFMSYTYPQFTTIDTFYTNAEGYLITPEKLPYGNGYSIVEVQAPYGYVLNRGPVYFDVTADNATVENAVTVVAVNRPDMPQKGRITITKVGEVFSSVTESGGVYQPVYEAKGLPGAVYEIIAAEDIYTPDRTLRYAKGTVVDTVTTGEDGIVISKALYLGKYEIREITAPYGMVLNGETHTVELTYAGQEIEITETATEFYNDRQRVQLDLSKVMERDETFNIGNNGEILSVQFGLFAAEDLTAADGSVVPKNGLIETVTCDENGYAVFATDLPVGAKLYVKEIATDSHYILSDTQYPVNFEYAGQEVATVNITVNDGEPIENDILRGDILGHKTDRETGENIAGAVFGLFASDTTEYTEDNAILTAITGEDGVFTFENLPYGSYVIVELSPAEGYLPNKEPHHVHVTTDGEVIEISVVNDKIPEIGTTATVDGEKQTHPNEQITIEDVVEYKHLIPGKEYTIKGTLMDKATGEPFLVNGQPVTSEVTFIPEDFSGFVTVTFVFDGKGITQNTDLVVFESLYKDGIGLAVHADIEDEGQTVTVLVPEIGTTATVDGEKEVNATEVFTLEDVVAYEHLIPGKEYVLKGVLMDKTTGKPLLIDGEEVHSETTFMPETPSGEVTVSFTFDSKYIKADTDIVVFESLYKDGLELTVHADIEDEGQTVTVHVPEIGTQATAEGKKEIEAKGEITIEDIVSYKNLTPGKGYTVSGVLMNKATGEPFTVNGKEIRSEITFTPETADGEVTVKFTFDATGLTTSTEVVVFESLYREGVEIAVHADIEDDGQTVKLTPPTPDVPQTGDNSNLGFWIGLGAIALGGLISVGIMAIKRKKDDDDE